MSRIQKTKHTLPSLNGKAENFDDSSDTDLDEQLREGSPKPQKKKTKTRMKLSESRNFLNEYEYLEMKKNVVGCSSTFVKIIIGIFFILLFYRILPYKFRREQWERILFCPIHDHSTFHFGVFDEWLFEGMTSKLPHNLTEIEREQRMKQIYASQARYEYTTDPKYTDFPPYIRCFSGVKCEEGFTIWDAFHFDGDVTRAVIGIRTNAVAAYVFQSFKSLDDYEILYRDVFLQEPLIATVWKLDSAFARQRLSGVDPILLTRIHSIPDKFKVDKNRLLTFLRPGKTWEEEMENGRFFLEDLEILTGLYTVPHKILADPLTLFYLGEGDTLLPMAIQLKQDPTISPCGTFYPTDDPIPWLFAKTAVQTALAAHHQVGAHLLLTHLLCEVWSIATHRHLAEEHPVHRLLHPHFHRTMDINERSRNFLIPEVISIVTSTGVEGAMELGGRIYKGWNFTAHYLPNDLINRGVWEPSLPISQQPLPGYDYRDFALPLWDVMHTYVGNILGEFYDSDFQLSEDYEIQAWAKEIGSPQGGRMVGFPDRFDSVSDLQDALTMMIFTASAQHAAVNFAQYNYLGWVPNMPLGTYLDEWPSSKDQITEEYFFKSLPPFPRSASQAGAVRVLSRLPDPWNTLINIPRWTNPKVQQHVVNFKEELLKLSKISKEKNENRSSLDKYPYLDPEQIPQSVAV